MLIKFNVSTRRKMSCVQVKRRWSGEGAQKRREEMMKKRVMNKLVAYKRTKNKRMERENETKNRARNDRQFNVRI